MKQQYRPYIPITLENHRKYLLVSESLTLRPRYPPPRWIDLP